MFRLR